MSSQSATANHYGISERSFNRIVAAIATMPEIEEVVIFGSRAMGTARRGSDIDLAIKGARVTDRTADELSMTLNERLPIPYYVDVVAYPSLSHENLREHIDTRGKLFYRK